MDGQRSTRRLAESIRSGRLGARCNLDEKILRISEREAHVRAFIDTYFDDAAGQAEKIDEKIGAGKPVGALCGLVVAVKNLIAVRGKRMTCGSKMLEEYVAPYDATVIEKIREADGIIIGSTNCDEFACGTDCTKSAFFSTINPASFEIGGNSAKDLFVPGGSSGGSAAAVAAGFCDLALATDTGGSIRCPAAFCGVTGIKPTYGQVSRYGMADMAMSLEQIGAVAPDTYGCALLLSVISGSDGRDSTTASAKKIEIEPLKSAENESEKKNKGKNIRIGVPKEFFEGSDEKVARLVRDAIGKISRKCGFDTVELSIPSVKYCIPAYYLLVYSEFASAMQKYDGLRYGAKADLSGELPGAASAVRTKNIGAECQRRIVLGTYITTKEHRDAWYTKALRARECVRQQFDEALGKCDALVGPTMPMLPWKIGQMNDNPLQQYLADVLTAPANLCGLPAASVPCGKIGGLPVGLQIIGRRFGDAAVLSLMGAAQAALQMGGGRA